MADRAAARPFEHPCGGKTPKPILTDADAWFAAMDWQARAQFMEDGRQQPAIPLAERRWKADGPTAHAGQPEP